MFTTKIVDSMSTRCQPSHDLPEKPVHFLSVDVPIPLDDSPLL